MIDVTIPFENRPESLEAARTAKEEKYAPLVATLEKKYGRVLVEAVVVGALGSWDPRNKTVMRMLCSRSYARLMEKLCVSDVVRWSRDIYVEHLTGVRQFV